MIWLRRPWFGEHVAEVFVDCNGKDINLQSEYDQLINPERSIPQGEVLRPTKVIGRAIEPVVNVQAPMIATPS